MTKPKRGRPRLRPGPGRPATGKNEMIAIRWSPPLLAGIDAYAQDQLMNRPNALRHIVTRFLVKEGLVDASVFAPAE